MYPFTDFNVNDVTRLKTCVLLIFPETICQNGDSRADGGIFRTGIEEEKGGTETRYCTEKLNESRALPSSL